VLALSKLGTRETPSGETGLPRRGSFGRISLRYNQLRGRSKRPSKEEGKKGADRSLREATKRERNRSREVRHTAGKTSWETQGKRGDAKGDMERRRTKKGVCPGNNGEKNYR